MMTLNTEELIALNAIIDNAPIYGLPLMDADIPESERVESVMNSLNKKEIIVETSLTDKGLILTRLLDEYKKCMSYAFINCLRIALIDDQHVIVVEKKSDEEYYISRCLKVTLIKKLIVSSTFLRKETKKKFIPFMKEKTEPEDLEKEVDNLKWTEVIMIQKHEENRLCMNCLYYMNTDLAYQYDYIDRTNVQMSPKDIRSNLMEILEIGGIGSA